MKEEYRIVSLNEYLNLINNLNYISISENEINSILGHYLLSLKRNETNAKIIESLIA